MDVFTNIGSQTPFWTHRIRIFGLKVQESEFLSSPGNSFPPAQHHSEDPHVVAIASGDPLSFSAGPPCPSGQVYTLACEILILLFL